MAMLACSLRQALHPMTSLTPSRSLRRPALILAAVISLAAGQAAWAETAPSRTALQAAEAAPTARAPEPVRTEADLPTPVLRSPEALPASPQPRADESLTRPKHLPLPRTRSRPVQLMA